MTKISEIYFDNKENTFEVHYKSGTVRKYSANALPKTILAFIDENNVDINDLITENVPAEPTPEQSDNAPVSEKNASPLYCNHIEFADSVHKELFLKTLEEMHVNDYDTFRIALAYLITLDIVCRKHISEIYDFCENCINPDCLKSHWQTSSSLRTTLLAFNLYSRSTLWCPSEFLNLCTPEEIFVHSGYIKYYIQAIQIFDLKNVPEQSEVSEKMKSPLEIPFDMRIKSLCRKCKHLESCFEKDRSNVLEDIHRSEPCDYDIFDEFGECGINCICCCSRFENKTISLRTKSVTDMIDALSDDGFPF